LWIYGCKCCIFHLINYFQNVGTLWLEFAILHFFSWTMCNKEIINSNTNTKKIWMIVLSTCTPFKHHTNTPFVENLNPKCDPKKKNVKFSHFKMEMRPKKFFPCKLCPFNIDVIFKHRNTSCTLLRLVYIILNNMIIYNFILICNGTIFSISEHVEWILRWSELLFFNTNVIFLIMIFHKTNKLSFNITWVHNKTLNVIPYFQDKTSHGRVVFCTLLANFTCCPLCYSYFYKCLYRLKLPLFFKTSQ